MTLERGRQGQRARNCTKLKVLSGSGAEHNFSFGKFVQQDTLIGPSFSAQSVGGFRYSCYSHALILPRFAAEVFNQGGKIGVQTRQADPYPFDGSPFGESTFVRAASGVFGARFRRGTQAGKPAAVVEGPGQIRRSALIRQEAGIQAQAGEQGREAALHAGGDYDRSVHRWGRVFLLH